MRRLRELWPLPAMVGMLFFLAVLVNFRPASPQSIGAGLNIRNAVVDIGPTTNTGPGDQTKGILNWSASPITCFASFASWIDRKAKKPRVPARCISPTSFAICLGSFTASMAARRSFKVCSEAVSAFGSSMQVA